MRSSTKGTCKLSKFQSDGSVVLQDGGADGALIQLQVSGSRKASEVDKGWVQYSRRRARSSLPRTNDPSPGPSSMPLLSNIRLVCSASVSGPKRTVLRLSKSSQESNPPWRGQNPGQSPAPLGSGKRFVCKRALGELEKHYQQVRIVKHTFVNMPTRPHLKVFVLVPESTSIPVQLLEHDQQVGLVKHTFFNMPIRPYLKVSTLFLAIRWKP